MALLDPPYNVRVRDIVGRGQIKHSEFAMASGELSRTSFAEFLPQSLAAAAAVARDGAVHFVCMDWRHLGELLEAGAVYDEMMNLVVWAKTNAGQGSFYRSAHETRRSVPCEQGSPSQQRRVRAPRLTSWRSAAAGRCRFHDATASGGQKIRPQSRAFRATVSCLRAPATC
jgi:hypothetical protein